MLFTSQGLIAQTTINTLKDITVPANKTVLHFTLQCADGGRIKKASGGAGATVVGHVNVAAVMDALQMVELDSAAATACLTMVVVVGPISILY